MKVIKIGFRTIKTAVGVSLSILIAHYLQLENFTAAGILTLLCIQRSRRQSNQAAVSRFLACMTGMLFSMLMFQLLGYHAYAFLVVLLLFIPFCVKLRIHEGIASSAVIMMHVFVHGKVEVSFLLNELFVVVIGLGVALLVNSYMPSIDKEMTRYKQETERYIAVILKEYACYLKKGYTLWDGNELLQLETVLRKASQIAQLDAENYRSLKKGPSYRQYFEQKRKQYDLLERLLPLVSQITSQLEQGERIGECMEQLSDYVGEAESSREDRYDYFYEMLRGVREYHKLLPLPQTRDEFENRASLFAVANELERFVNTL